jgi:hypothetical protein
VTSWLDTPSSANAMTDASMSGTLGRAG